MKRSQWLKLVFIGLLCIVGTGTWYYWNKATEEIFVYEPTRDRAFILNLFKQDWYWLVSDYSPDYSPEHMLDYKASSKDPKNTGNLTVKTLVKDRKTPVGFVAYYMKELFEGYILFLAVDKNYRSKGYARRLLSSAITDLKKHGAAVIRLITRTDNVRGRKLYTGMGFKDVWTDGAYIKYEKLL